MKRSKRYLEALSVVDRTRKYPIDEAIELLKSMPRKRDETVEVAVKLGVNPKRSDQMVRCVVNLPHGTGKPNKVLVFAKGEKEKEANEAGADIVGGDELARKIKEGDIPNVNTIISTPDMMGTVSSLGKILGPRGLMPNPKMGTVTYDIKKAIKEIKEGGRVEVRSDRTGCVHIPCGRTSFDKEAIKENVKVFVKTLESSKPPAVKGNFIRSITMSTTFSPGVKIEPMSLKDKKKK